MSHHHKDAAPTATSSEKQAETKEYQEVAAQPEQVAAHTEAAAPQTPTHTEVSATKASAAPEWYAKLQTATHDLYYPSESDEPINAVLWPAQAEAGTAAQVQEQAKVDAAAQVKEISAEKFFERVLKTEDWYGEEEKALVQRFTELKKLLEENLRDLKGFRFGETEIDVYLVGLDNSGNLGGVATKIVET